MKNYLLLGIGLTLSACGGGGGVATSEIDKSYSESSAISTSVIKEYSNGQAVVAVKGDLEDGGPSNAPPRYYFVLSENAQTVIDTFNGVIAWDSIENKYLVGQRYGVIRRGVNTLGKDVYADTDGINLNLSGNEYASVSYVEIGDEIGLLTSGTVISKLPSGKYSYDGEAVIGLNSLIEGSENFLLVADFNNKKVSFTGSTENLFTSANNLSIDTVNGSFSGDEATIGERYTTFSLPASVIGAFAGSNAGGVHGVAYPSNDDQNNAFVTFVAVR